MKAARIYQIAFLLFLFSLFSGKMHAQYFISGQDPGSTKWNQIKTEKFRIIFPKNYLAKAQQYINLFELSSDANNAVYRSKLRRIPVVLHNQTTTSNAYAAIAPMRLDFLEMPAQTTYPQPWNKQLVLHEYRHTIQQYKLRQGLTKGLYYVFGDQGVAFIMGLYLPFWFIEGDAVFAETVFSNSGRGRVPEFTYTLKAQVLDKKIYKYDKATYGSYRDYVPDHYTLGYQLLSKGVESYGTGLWNNVMDRVARRPYYLLPFTISLKQQTGFYKVQLYKKMLSELKQEWWIKDQHQKDSTFKVLSPNNKFYTSYHFPVENDDGLIIAEKTGVDDINRFVVVDRKGKEQRVFTPGFDFYESLSVSAGKILWNEKTYDPRWDMRNYSVLKIYDTKTGKVNKLTRRSRYFAPSLSGDGHRIAAVYVSNESAYALHILDAATGKNLKKFETEENLFFMTPHWSADGRFVVAVVMGDKGKSIAKINPQTGEMNFLVPFSFTEIKWPVMSGNWVVFTGTMEGKDNLYGLNLKSGKIVKIFDARFGANYPSFSKDGKKLLFSNYTSDGYQIASIDFTPDKYSVFVDTTDHTAYRADRLVTPTTFNLDEVSVPDSTYAVSKYRKGAHLFNLHSWGPLAVDADNYTANPGITLLSQNVLSSAVSSLSYLYDVNEQTSKIEFGLDYYGWYPKIGFTVDYGGRKGIYRPDTGDAVRLKWRETNLSLLLSVPLNFTSSKWIKGLQPLVGINQKFRRMDESVKKVDFRESDFTIPVYRFYAYNQLKRSPKDIYPRWGQSVDILYRHTPFSSYVNSQAGVVARVYFPGLARHHSLKIYGGYQQSVVNNYSFSNFVATPRGYTNVFLPEYFSLRSDYALPVAYPDWNVPGIFYLKRITSDLFYDYLLGNNGQSDVRLSSVGIELYSDWHFLSILINVNLGVRISYQFDVDEAMQNNFTADDMNYEFLIGFSY